MAWQSPNCVAHALQSARSTYLRSSLSHRAAAPAYILSRPTQQRSHTRGYATEAPGAAAPIDFDAFKALPARIVPASPSYFSGSPKFLDQLLKLESVLARYATLPTVSGSDVPRASFFKRTQFRGVVHETVTAKKFKTLLKILQRLNRIDPRIMPEEVKTVLSTFMYSVDAAGNKPTPPTVDEMGRSRGKGKRKASSAVVHLVEGDGQVLVNGKTLVEVFPRVHDRESATWALRSTSRLDKYNVWATVRGGGTTGQAEAITLALGRALLVHEPALKTVLRKSTYFHHAKELNSESEDQHVLTSPSRRHHLGSPPCGEEETWSRQGAQDARLGQEMKHSPSLPFLFSPYIVLSITHSSHLLFLSVNLESWSPAIAVRGDPHVIIGVPPVVSNHPGIVWNYLYDQLQHYISLNRHLHRRSGSRTSAWVTPYSQHNARYL